MGIDVTGIGSIFDFGSKVIDKIFPDKDAAAKAKLAMLQLQQDGQFKELELQFQADKAQSDTNTAEATSSSIFVAGWRPAIGWVCGAALFSQFIGVPFIAWVSLVAGISVPLPSPDWTQLTPVMMGMLGLGAMRTYEKRMGVA